MNKDIIERGYFFFVCVKVNIDSKIFWIFIYVFNVRIYIFKSWERNVEELLREFGFFKI